MHNAVLQGNGCPRLEQETSGGGIVTVAKGAETIQETLRQENKKSREASQLSMHKIMYYCTHLLQMDCKAQHPCFVLYAFVPILEGAPEGWSLALVDTPGFGEANVDHIMRHTDMLFSTSTAYLYLMDSTIMEDGVDSDNIKLLFKHNKGTQEYNVIIIAEIHFKHKLHVYVHLSRA